MNVHKFIYECVVCTNLWDFLYIKLEGFAFMFGLFDKKKGWPQANRAPPFVRVGRTSIVSSLILALQKGCFHEERPFCCANLSIRLFDKGEKWSNENIVKCFEICYLCVGIKEEQLGSKAGDLSFLLYKLG